MGGGGGGGAGKPILHVRLHILFKQIKKLIIIICCCFFIKLYVEQLCNVYWSLLLTISDNSDSSSVFSVE